MVHCVVLVPLQVPRRAVKLAQKCLQAIRTIVALEFQDLTRSRPTAGVDVVCGRQSGGIIDWLSWFALDCPIGGRIPQASGMKPASQRCAEALGGTPIGCPCGAQTHDSTARFQFGTGAIPVPKSKTSG